jgi:hypothetical protein
MVCWPECLQARHRAPRFGYKSKRPKRYGIITRTGKMEMIKLFRIIGVGAAAPANWVIGQFGDPKEALAEYNSEFRRAKSEGIDDGRPELEFVTDNREVEYFLAEEEVTHTPARRDASVETGRWGLARKRGGA